MLRTSHVIMTDLVQIVGKLREAAVQAKRECDSQIEQAICKMSKKIKDEITSSRYSQYSFPISH